MFVAILCLSVEVHIKLSKMKEKGVHLTKGDRWEIKVSKNQTRGLKQNQRLRNTLAKPYEKEDELSLSCFQTITIKVK